MTSRVTHGNKKVTTKDLCSLTGIDETSIGELVANKSAHPLSRLRCFQVELENCGKIVWRRRSGEVEIVAWNDYNPENGEIKVCYPPYLWNDFFLINGLFIYGALLHN